MFKRKVYNSLLEWKETSNGSTALLIEGARRIGKSTIAELFGANEFPAYKLIDFSIYGDEFKEIGDELFGAFGIKTNFSRIGKNKTVNK